jgi:hypothetical protein
MRYHSNMKNESKNSANLKNRLENPKSARVEVSLAPARRNDAYARYIEFVDSQIDNNRGYKGKNEDHGRKPGSRVVSIMVGEEELFYVA